jgi:hypothetical protein
MEQLILAAAAVEVGGMAQLEPLAMAALAL